MICLGRKPIAAEVSDGGEEVRRAMVEPRVLPVEEMVSEEEFTDRVEILRELEDWYRNIKRRISSSLALISPRRMGKTALLDRLVNTVFFKDYDVAPFYFKMKREETTLRKFLLEYYTTFFRQYIAYILKDPALYGDRGMKLRDLLKLKTNNEKVQYVQREHLARFIERYEGYDWQDARNHWEDMIATPEFLGAMLGVHVAVIIDEFQDMKFYIYDAEDEKEVDPEIHRPTDLTATYDRKSQSRRAPMLVSGSAVTMIFRTVMGGPLGGRFGFKYLKPMAIEDGATLIKKLLRMRGSDITDELAIYLSSQVNGHPYYVYCCAESDCPDKDFTTKEGIDRVVEYEVTRGKIFGFWETHFQENRKYINQDNDIELGKKIIYYFTKYNNAPVDIEEIAGKLKVSKYAVEEKIEKLYQADLVYRSDFKYYTFNDIMLMRYIQHRYENELKDVEKVDLGQQGLFNYVKGKFLEMVVQNIMSKFNNEDLDGRLFGHPGEVIKAPLFRARGDMVVKLPSSAEHQVDAYGDYEKDGVKHIWVAECKYRKDEPMTSKEVEKAIEAAGVVKVIRNARDMKVWLVSTGGFTKDALELMRENGCLFSGQDEINEIARLYGIGVKIVEFQ
ncbi:MAG TPA: restriction endonuclease [Firmicutes bacterium]|nr:restriction endonuclease [Bacillota bacterium]